MYPLQVFPGSQPISWSSSRLPSPTAAWVAWLTMVTPMTVDAWPFLKPTHTHTWLPLSLLPSSTHPEKPIRLLAQGSTLALKLSAGVEVVGVGASLGDPVSLGVGLPSLAAVVADGVGLSTSCPAGAFIAAKMNAPPSSAARPRTRKPTMGSAPDRRRGGSSSS